RHLYTCGALIRLEDLELHAAVLLPRCCVVTRIHRATLAITCAAQSIARHAALHERLEHRSCAVAREADVVLVRRALVRVTLHLGRRAPPRGTRASATAAARSRVRRMLYSSAERSSA